MHTPKQVWKLISRSPPRRQDVLPVVAVLPQLENPEENVLIKATTGSQPFDNQLYLFEAVGTLISLLLRDPSEQLRLMEAVIGPLVRDIDAGLRKPMTGGPDDALQILQIHHLIMSIGSIAKGFPDAPEILPTQAPQWIAAFEQASDGIFRALDVMKSQRIVRDAVRAKRFVRFRHNHAVRTYPRSFWSRFIRHAARSPASSRHCPPV